MLSEMGLRPGVGGSGGGDGFGSEDFGKELEMLLCEQRRQEASDRERDLSLYRSGSAPPTVEGSLAAVGGLFGGAGSSGASDFSGGKNGNGLLSEEELRSDPTYLSYYYSHVNLNPRLPPPILSKEDWRFAQRLQAGSSALGGVGDRRKVSTAEEGGSGSLFSKQPSFNLNKEEMDGNRRKARGSGDWMDRGGDGLFGLSGITHGQQRSFVEILQDDLGHTTPISSHPSRPTSRNAFNNGVEHLSSSEAPLGLHNGAGSLDGLRPDGNVQHVAEIQNIGALASRTFASVLSSSLSRSTTPDPQLVARAPSPCLPPVGTRPGATDKRASDGSCSFNFVSSSISESEDLVAALAGMNLSSSGEIDEHNIARSKLQQEIDGQHGYIFDSQSSPSHMEQYPFLKSSEPRNLDMPSIPHSSKRLYTDMVKSTGDLLDLGNATLRTDSQFDLQRSTHSSPSSFPKAPAGHSVGSPGVSPAHFLNGDSANGAFMGFGQCGYLPDPALTSMMANHIGMGNLPPLFENAVAASGMASPTMGTRALGGFSSGSNLTGATGLQNLNRLGDTTTATSLQIPLLDPLYIQYLRSAEYAAQAAANFNDPSMERGYMGNSYVDLLGMQKAYLESLLQQQKQFDMPFLGKSGGLNHGYYGNPAFGLGMSYSGSPLANSVLPTTPAGPGSPLRHGERNVRFPSGMRNFAGGVMGSWHSDIGGNMDGSLASSLLDEFKNNKTKCYELSDIAGHVVEFSADQFGSRFIQQKLETAATEEKDMVFEETMPQALTLMTDVFGNYVIQKFLDHGSAAQIRELADQLIGHVLTLSLQMYGCRVIQKAIEVVDLDQKTKMVTELDGHVMRCVRDQNGNHVIQKCIECIPQDAIQFIITSFYGQVVMLSTHPYGCRVIQRVLEHCDDPKTQQIVMDEIMQSVCMLAQDQYGNYVVQHMLEHGKPHERSAIIEKLAGQIVQMSQQKFASNVVEKCLTFGDPAERQILVNEMLGTTDENEPLQAMMKDQFANYVVQKVLETSDDQQLELILSRIKVHLNALKKYTYGKHIVARVEKLVVAGERRIGIQSSHTS